MQCAICKNIIKNGKYKSMWIGVKIPHEYNVCLECYDLLNHSDAQVLAQVTCGNMNNQRLSMCYKNSPMNGRA